MLDLGLAGKRALVVGTGDGMGRSCVLGLTEAGARVACLDLVAEAAETSADAANAAGGEAFALAGDAADRTAVEAAVETVCSKFGGIDVTIHVAAAWRHRPFLELEDDDWAFNMEHSLRQTFVVSQTVGARMVEQGGGGAILNVASIAAHTGAPNMSAYAAAKAGLISISKSAALELGPYGVRFNVVAPGFTWNPGLEKRWKPEQFERQANAIPLRRIGQPEDQAKVMITFVSDLTAYVTGQVISVDGGAMAMYPLPPPVQ